MNNGFWTTSDWLYRSERGRKNGVRAISLAQRPQHLSEQRNNQYLRPVHRTSVVHLAHVIPQRSISVAARSASVFGSQFFSMHQSNASGIGDLGADKDKNSQQESPRLLNSVTEQEMTGPVIVELPHESITIEDYARPMYRKDIFFP